MSKPAEPISLEAIPHTNQQLENNAATRMSEDATFESSGHADKSTSKEPEILNFEADDIYANPIQNSNSSKAEILDGWKVTYSDNQENPTRLNKGSTNIELPEGATDVHIKNGLPVYTRNGVTVDLDANGQPKAYHSNGFSFEHHEDNDTWYYHQDAGGEYVQIDVPTLKEDGSVSTNEHGGINSGREHSLNSSGQTTENAIANTFEQVKEVGSDAFAWVKENKALTTMPLLALPAMAIDETFGTDIYGIQNAFVNGFGETLVDGTVNGVVYIAGLAQGGLQEIGAMPEDWKKIDQIVPDLDFYQFDSENASTAEKWAHGIGEVAGIAVPFAGTAGAAIKATKTAATVISEGRVLSTLSETATSLASKAANAGSAVLNKVLRRNGDDIPTTTVAVSPNALNYEHFIDSGISPQNIVGSINESNRLGQGYANVVYKLDGTDDYVIRVPRDYRPNLTGSERVDRVHDFSPEGNFGQPVARVGEIEILKKVDGVALKEAPRQAEMSRLLETIRRQSPQARHARQERVIAAMPQSAFDQYAADLIELAQKGKFFDSVNPGNVLVSNQRFNIVDLGSQPISLTNGAPDLRSAGTGLYEMLRPLLGTRVDNMVPSTSSGVLNSYQQIIEKSVEAAQKAGIAIVPDPRLQQIFAAAGIPEKYSALMQGRRIDPNLDSILRRQNYL